MIETSKPILNYDYELQQWKLITPIVLSKFQLDRVVEYALIQYKKRVQGEIGEKRKRMTEAIENLKSENVYQFLVGDNNEKTLYYNGK